MDTTEHVSCRLHVPLLTSSYHHQFDARCRKWKLFLASIYKRPEFRANEKLKLWLLKLSCRSHNQALTTANLKIDRYSHIGDHAEYTAQHTYTHVLLSRQLALHIEAIEPCLSQLILFVGPIEQMGIAISVLITVQNIINFISY